MSRGASVISENASDSAPFPHEDDGRPRSKAADERVDSIVIGSELASAADAEERRKARGNVEPSPMPDQVYDFWRGEMSLNRPVALPLDAAAIAMIDAQRVDYRDILVALVCSTTRRDGREWMQPNCFVRDRFGQRRARATTINNSTCSWPNWRANQIRGAFWRSPGVKSRQDTAWSRLRRGDCAA